jgi:23S rRNA pseudouridine1911/1915/1917 synthase
MSPGGFTAGPGEAGLRLDAALAARGLAASRAAAQRLIDAGLVTVEGSARPKSHKLVAGETVDVAEPPPPPPPPEAPALAIAYEDEHLLVVDKPAGLVVHPGAGPPRTTLVDVLGDRAAGGSDPKRPGIVHRLDRDTSGLLVVARSGAVHSALQDMLRKREIAREYLALVAGRPDARHGTIDAPIGRDRANRTVMSTRTDKPRAAVTHFTVAEALPRTTLLSVRLETGRTHQIRAHLAELGLPVCGDEPYGGGPCGARIGLERQFLHSSKLMFRHPVTGGEVLCESKPPADLRRALDAARRDPVSGGPDGDFS